MCESHKAVIWMEVTNSRFVRVCGVRVSRGESTVTAPLEIMPANGRSDDNCRNAEDHLLRVRTNAASAIAAPAQGRFVRDV